MKRAFRAFGEWRFGRFGAGQVLIVEPLCGVILIDSSAALGMTGTSAYGGPENPAVSANQ